MTATALAIQLAINVSLVQASVFGVVVLIVGALFAKRYVAQLQVRDEHTVRERSLRIANLRLTSANSADEINTVTLETVAALANGLSDGRASIVRVRDQEIQVVAAVGHNAEAAVETTVPIQQLRSEILDAMEKRHSVEIKGSYCFDLEAHSESAETTGDEFCLFVPLVTQDILRGFIVVATETPLSPEVRTAIELFGVEVSFATENSELAEQLHRERANRSFQALIENSSDLILVVDQSHRCRYASPSAVSRLGLDQNDGGLVLPNDLVHPDDQWLWQGMLPPFDDWCREDEAITLRLNLKREGYRWFEVVNRDLSDETEIGGVVLTARDISERRAAEDRLALSEERFRALVQISPDVVAILDEDARFTYVSPGIEGVLGFTPDELIGTHFAQLVTMDEVDRVLELADSIPNGKFKPFDLEVKLVTSLGQWRNADINVSDLRAEPAVQGITLYMRDVTVRRALEYGLEFKALHDELTGLGNREMFHRRIKAALERIDPRADHVAILLIEINDFKAVNESYGYAVGDQLLISVADRLRGCLRVSDVAVRSGADDFAALLEDVYSEEEVLAVVERILIEMGRPFVIDGRDVLTTVSVGVAIDPDRSSSEDELLRQADLVLNLAKRRGGNVFEVFRPDQHSDALSRFQLRLELTEAIEQNQLVLHYQPIVDLNTWQVSGCEALVRWNHPERGLLSPNRFIPVAEESDLIVALGDWVIREASRQLREWTDETPTAANLRMSVNLSVRQLQNPAIASDIIEILSESDISPDRFTIEITETLMMEREQEFADRLQQLRSKGFRLAVDDFGTGYSSLGYIQQFAMDIIKIDRSFVDRMKGSASASGLVRTIIEIATELDCVTVAEGIETPVQASRLARLGCNYGQGYYFSKPIDAQEFIQMLKSPLHLSQSL
ncbi:MAG: EAL domain-containing protein [Acidimicrobiia bacterium]